MKNEEKDLPLTKNRQDDRQKNGLLPSFCPHLFASKVEEASRLLVVKDQRRYAAATFPVLRSVNFELLPRKLSGLQTLNLEL
jgi:hypothetical protein